MPVKVNGDLRPSRLVKSIPAYVSRNMLTILRFFVVYKPLRFFALASLLPFFISFGLFSRFILFYLFVSNAGKIQSLIVAGVMFLFGILLVAIGLLSDIISINRRLLEDLRFEAQLRKLEKEREP